MNDQLAKLSDKHGGEVTHQPRQDFMPVMDIQTAVKRRNHIVEFTREIMVEGIDFGTIPGTNKPTLYKPGAEKLTTFFGLSPDFEILEKELDWTGDWHGGEPFFYFQYKAKLYRDSLLVGTGVGSCNSWEKKYRYRKGELVCPNCHKSGTIIKGKEEFGGGWLCWNKRGGCGSKWNDGAQVIEGQDVGDVPNPNPQDIVNTIDKMAQKRALIAATLIAVNASEFFTQDLEDMDLGDGPEIVEGKVKEAPPKAPEPKPSPQQTAEHPAKATSEVRVENQWEQEIRMALMSLNLFDHPKQMVNTLNLSAFTERPVGELETWEAVAWVLAREDLKEQNEGQDYDSIEISRTADDVYPTYEGQARDLLAALE